MTSSALVALLLLEVLVLVLLSEETVGIRSVRAGSSSLSTTTWSPRTSFSSFARLERSRLLVASVASSHTV